MRADALLKTLGAGTGTGAQPLPATAMPPERAAPTPAHDPNALLDQIEEMRASGSYDWCDDILRGIYDTVKRTRHVTEGQAAAVEHIREGRRRRSPACYVDDDDDLVERRSCRRTTGGVYRSVKP